MPMYPKIKINVGKGYDPVEMQQYTDTDLETENKTVVGAINELDQKNKNSQLEVALELANKVDQTRVIESDEPNYIFEFSVLDNAVVRLKVAESISFNFAEGEYSKLYATDLSFDSGGTPTSVDYVVPDEPNQVQVINWVGVDCVNTSYVNSGGETVPISVFNPSANKHYEVSFTYNGTQIIAWVGGFVPASGNVVAS